MNQERIRELAALSFLANLHKKSLEESQAIIDTPISRTTEEMIGIRDMLVGVIIAKNTLRIDEQRVLQITGMVKMLDWILDIKPASTELDSWFNLITECYIELLKNYHEKKGIVFNDGEIQ